jgi:signal recognition particle receptor subunit beta
MVQINFALKEVNCKVVFYGPGMSGKTTNLEIVHQKAPEENKGDLTSISTDGDRTLFFDFMPLDLGNVAGMRTKFQLYTVPGQVYYNSTRKLVLQGVDGVIFVADSDPEKMDENVESYANLIENLAEYGKDVRELPHVIQYNKRDLPGAMPVADIDKILNKFGVPTFEAVAYTGEGVFPTLKTLAAMVLESIEKIDGRSPRQPAPAREKAAPVAAAAAPPQQRRAAARPPAGPRQGAPRKRRPAGPAAAAAGAQRPAGKRPAGKLPAGRGRSPARAARASARAARAEADQRRRDRRPDRVAAGGRRWRRLLRPRQRVDGGARHDGSQCHVAQPATATRSTDLLQGGHRPHRRAARRVPAAVGRQVRAADRQGRPPRHQARRASHDRHRHDLGARRGFVRGHEGDGAAAR